MTCGAGAPTVALEGVSFGYRDAPEIVHDVSLRVAPSECVVLCGPSGGGKTTLIRLINGLAGGYYKGEVSGTVALGGRDASTLAQWERSEWVGSVFQDPSAQFFSSQLAGEIAFTYENLGYAHKERARRLLRDLGLWELREQHPATLSGGQRQRLSIACGLMSERYERASRARLGRAHERP